MQYSDPHLMLVQYCIFGAFLGRWFHTSGHEKCSVTLLCICKHGKVSQCTNLLHKRMPSEAFETHDNNNNNSTAQ